MRIGFLLSDLGLSGGVNVVLKHAYFLSQIDDYQVHLILQNPQGPFHDWAELDNSPIKIQSVSDASNYEFDLVLATWWETLFNLSFLRSDRYVWFCQSLEDRFYNADDQMMGLAASTLCVPITTITESKWIEERLLAVNPDRKVFVVPNGVDKTIFNRPVFLKEDQSSTRSLNVLIEGNLSNRNKGIREALDGLEICDIPLRLRHITTDTNGVCSVPNYRKVIGPLTFEMMAREYREADLLVKTSRVEGMFGPPLEAFHCGATAVVTPVTGHEDYITHGHNSLVVEWDSPRAIADALQRLYVDVELLNRLKVGAVETAVKWPSWEASSTLFHDTLVEILRSPPSISGGNLAAIINGIRLMRLWNTRERHLLLGFTHVADERLEIIRNLKKNNQTPHIAASKKSLRWYRGIVSRLRY